MSSTPRVCDRKKPYPCRAAAKKAVRWAEQKFKTKMYAYKCPTCSFFHLATKIENRDRRPWLAPR